MSGCSRPGQRESSVLAAGGLCEWADSGWGRAELWGYSSAQAWVGPASNGPALCALPFFSAPCPFFRRPAWVQGPAPSLSAWREPASSEVHALRPACRQRLLVEADEAECTLCMKVGDRMQTEQAAGQRVQRRQRQQRAVAQRPRALQTCTALRAAFWPGRELQGLAAAGALSCPRHPRLSALLNK